MEKRRLVTETVSGNSAIEQRSGFLKLLDRPERDDVLVVTKAKASPAAVAAAQAALANRRRVVETGLLRKEVA